MRLLFPFGPLSKVWLALPYIKSTQMWNYPLPNKFNFAFDYYIACLLASAFYIPGLPFLYSYLLKQRAKMLGGSKPGGKSGKQA